MKFMNTPGILRSQQKIIDMLKIIKGYFYLFIFLKS